MDSKDCSCEQLLERLDMLLAEADVKWEENNSESNPGELNDPDYTEQSKEYRKVSSQQ